MQQQVVISTINQPVVQVQVPHDSQVYGRYNNQSSLILGALQIVIGLLAMFFNLAAILLSASYSAVSHGFWCGIFFVGAGIFGVKASVLRTGCLIVAFMVLSIINAVLSVILLSISASGINQDKSVHCFMGVCYSSSSGSKEIREGQIAVNGFLVGLALAEFIFSIWSICICSAAVCSGRSTSQAVAVIHVNRQNQAQVSANLVNVNQPVVQTFVLPAFTTGGPQPQLAGYPANYVPPAYNTNISPGYSYPTGQAGVPAASYSSKES